MSINLIKLGVNMYLSSKRFGAVTTCHRNHHAITNKNRNSVKCGLIHGYSRVIDVTFTCEKLSNEGWVYDFGDCQYFKEWFDKHFDHKVLVSSDDPQLNDLLDMEEKGLLSLTIIPAINGHNPSIEGSCKWVYDTFNDYIDTKPHYKDRGVRVYSVRIYEHDKNWAEYRK